MKGLINRTKVDTLSNELGIEILHCFKYIDINQLVLNKKYQRNIELSRVTRLLKSIKRNGYWEFQTILINEKNEIIDGQHRYEAAKKAGIKLVGCTVITFPSEVKEALFFTEINNFVTTLKAPDFWYARYMCGHPVAKLMCELNDDKNSLLFKKIAVKGEQSKNTKFIIGDALLFISTSCGNHIIWTRETEERYNKLIASYSYQEIRNSVNLAVSFFHRVCGVTKADNPIPYRSGSIRSILYFYLLLHKQGFLSTDKKIDEVVHKMKLFSFNSDFIKTDYIGRMLLLTNHFNRGKKNQLSYNGYDFSKGLKGN